MARPKEFDRTAALEGALGTFWAKGYEAASTDELLVAMGIGRQSMYDTFGDKWQLYLESLRCYHKVKAGTLQERLQSAKSPLDVLATFLGHFAYQDAAERARGCMGINATTAFGRNNAEVTALARQTAKLNEKMIGELVSAAQAEGDLAASIDPRSAARFLYATLQGLTVRAQAGASSEELRDAADFAIKALVAMH